MRTPQMPEAIATRTYFDREFGKQAIKLLPNEYYVSSEDVVLTTVLGSCVAACIRDEVAGVGGMNHFMLPDDENAGADRMLSPSMRYGCYALEVLINELLGRARRERLEAKVFGGGAVLANMTTLNIGDRNADFVLRYLKTENIRVAAQDLRGPHARRVSYFPRSGLALVRRLTRQTTVCWWRATSARWPEPFPPPRSAAGPSCSSAARLPSRHPEAKGPETIMSAAKIKVLCVDDSALIRSLMTEIINSQSDMEVVGTAPDPLVAREMIKRLNPDVLTLDVEMPRMDGLDFLERLMRLRPMPVLMVSSLTERGSRSPCARWSWARWTPVTKPARHPRRPDRVHRRHRRQDPRGLARARAHGRAGRRQPGRRHAARAAAQPVAVHREADHRGRLHRRNRGHQGTVDAAAAGQPRRHDRAAHAGRLHAVLRAAPRRPVPHHRQGGRAQ